MIYRPHIRAQRIRSPISKGRSETLFWLYQLSSTLGIKQTNTLAHNPKSNAKIERVWEFVGRALKAMPAEKYEQFHLHLPFLAHVWNNTPDSDTGVTPFEAEHGMPMRGVAESLVRLKVEVYA